MLLDKWKDNRWILNTSLAALALVVVFLVVGCSVSSEDAGADASIVGSWEPVNESGNTMTFWESGNCENVTYEGNGEDLRNGNYNEYSLESDGTVILIGDYWGDRVASIKQTTDRDKAAYDSNLYCLEGDSLIWDTKAYKQV